MGIRYASIGDGSAHTTYDRLYIFVPVIRLAILLSLHIVAVHIYTHVSAHTPNLSNAHNTHIAYE
jgi:hypothetical protein